MTYFPLWEFLLLHCVFLKWVLTAQQPFFIELGRILLKCCAWWVNSCNFHYQCKRSASLPYVMLKNASLSVLVVLTSEILFQIYCCNCKQKHVTLKLFSRATCWNELCAVLNPFSFFKETLLSRQQYWSWHLGWDVPGVIRCLCRLCSGLNSHVLQQLCFEPFDPCGWDSSHLTLWNELMQLNYEL